MVEDPYRAVLGEIFNQLHPMLQRSHSAPLKACGTFDIERGSSRISNWIADWFRLPRKASGQVVRLELRAVGEGVRWVRFFGTDRLVTFHTASRGELIEQVGKVRFYFDLQKVGDNLVYRTLRVTWVGLLLPRCLCPIVSATIQSATAAWTVEVTVIAPIVGFLGGYTGVMVPE